MSKRNKGRISRIRGNLKYENNDPLWKKLFYIKENIKQYKGVVIVVILSILLVITLMIFLSLTKNNVKNDIVIREEINEQTNLGKNTKNKLNNTEEYIKEIVTEVLNEQNVSSEEKKIREFLVRLYNAGGYSSKKTYIELLKKLNPTYNIGKITEENENIYVIAKNIENTEKEEVININKILEKFDFDIEVLGYINKKRIDEKAFKYEDILIDNELSNEILLKFKEITTIDIKRENEKDTIITEENISNNNITNNVETTGQIATQNKLNLKENEIEIKFVDENIILEKYIIEKGSIPKFLKTPQKDGYLFVEWDKNIFSKVYENTTYVAKWISYKDLGTRIVVSYDLDGGIGTFPAVITERGKTFSEILEKNGGVIPIKQGYTFKGWNIEPTTKIEEDTIIKALWSRVE